MGRGINVSGNEPPEFKMPDESELVDGINEIPMAPGLSTRFGYCKRCRNVYPPELAHECKVAP